MNEKTIQIEQLKIALGLKRKNLHGMQKQLEKLEKQIERVNDEIGIIKSTLSELRMEDE